jgi:hypothetical protein
MLSVMRWVVTVVATLVLLLAFTGTSFAQSIPSPPSGKPTPADEATAKKNFESGLKLYGEGSFAEALIAFEQSYRIGGRPSALKNIAQCHRNLKHFVEAYEAYEQMLALHEAQLPAADKTAVKQALDELGVLTGTIEIVVSEAGADIEIDGKSVGQSPMSKPKRVKVEAHTVKVTKAGFERFEQSVNVGSQEQKKVDVKLEVEKNVGRVSIREQNGREVHVFVDGADKGPAPWEGEVAAGEHTVEARSARFTSEVRRINVIAKERLDVALDAAPLLGRLRVTTVPATATIRVDGKDVGTGAWEGELSEGVHRIEVAAGSEPPQVREVSISRGQTLVQEIPVVSAIATGRVTDYVGIFVKISIFGAVGVSGNQENDVSPVSQSGSFMGIGGAALRVGRAWDWYGAELVGMFFFEHRDRQYQVDLGTPQNPYSYNFQDESNAVNAFIGIGGRATSKDDFVRFTAGLAPGLMIRTFSPKRNQSNGGSQPPNNTNPNPGGNRFVQPTPTGGETGTSQPSCNGNCNTDQDFSGAGYTTFGLVLDGGILLGSTPGTKFYLGVNAIMDFAPTLVTGPDTKTPIADSLFKSPGRGIILTDGMNFYIGPTLGLQFGH